MLDHSDARNGTGFSATNGMPVYRNNRDKAAVLVPIMMLIAFQQGFSQFGVILDNLQVYFPDASQTTVQMVVAVTSITAIPVSLLSGLLATFFTRKKIAIVALFIMLFGGVLPVFLHDDIMWVFLSSALIGVSQGLIISTSTGMCAENFVGSDRDFAIGMKQVTDCIGNAIIAVAIGQLAMLGWFYSYVVYLLVIPIIIFVVKFLPERPPDKKLYSKDHGFEGLKFVKNPQFIYMLFFMMICGFANFGLYFNGAMIAVEKGLGDTTFISIVFSASNIISLVFGLLYMPIAKLLGRNVFAVSLLLVSVGYFVFYVSDSIPVFIAAGLIWGMACSLIQSSSLVFLANSLPPGSYGMGLAIGNAMINVGISLSPIVANTLRTVLFGTTSATDSIMVFGLGCLVAAVVELLRQRIMKSKGIKEVLD